jgi:hypothetical protein
MQKAFFSLMQAAGCGYDEQTQMRYAAAQGLAQRLSVLAAGPEAEAVELPSCFGDFFVQHFGYSLHSQQLELFDWFYAGLQRGLVQERQVLAMRRIGKSDILTLAAVAWKLLHDRSFKVLIVSKSPATLGVFNRKLRDIFAHYQLLEQASLEHISLKGSQNVNSEKSYSLRFISATCNKRGLRADHIVLDDLVDASDASPAIAAITALAYAECRSIVPSTTLIGQLADEDDLPSTLRQRAEVQTKELWIDGLQSELASAIGMPNKEQLMRELPLRYYGHNYAGQHFRDKLVQHFYDTPVGDFQRSDFLFAFIDPSFGGKDSSGITLASVVQGRIFAQVTEQKINFSCPDQLSALLRRLKHEQVDTLFIEANNGGAMLFATHELLGLASQLELSIHKIHHHQPKVQRIMALYPYKNRITLSGQANCVHRWQPAHSTTSSKWPDDGIDSLAMAVHHLATEGFLLE